MLEVVCAVIVDDGKVLLCRRAEGTHLAGHWEFPGGKVEEGEEPEEALRREIAEELGCTVEVGDGLAAVEHHYETVSIRLQPFQCRVVDGEPHPHEHEEIALFAVEDLPDAGLAGADVVVAKQVVGLVGRV